MRLLILLNGGNLWRFPDDMPHQLEMLALQGAHDVELQVSRSPEHAQRLLGAAIERGIDGIFAGGGDGTLHHIVNHTLIHKVALAPLPLGTVNAFLRAEGVDVSNPVAAMRQLLGGRIADGWCGLMAGRRFACFASLGFDARVVHNNPTAIKRWLRKFSYGVTGALELAQPWHACPGSISSGSGKSRRRVTSLIVSKIANYAGVKCFPADATQATLEGIAIRSDSPLSLGLAAAYLALHGPARGRPAPGGVLRLKAAKRIEWRSASEPTVQLDGEATTLSGTREMTIGIDPKQQRYFLP